MAILCTLFLFLSFPFLSATETLKLHGADHPSRYLRGRQSPHPHCTLTNPTNEMKSHFIDHAARVLRRKGYGVVASALATKKPELLYLNDVTVFATSDKILFSEVKGFSYDFLRHVVPKRHRLDKIRRLRSIETLSPEKTITVGSGDGFSEIYRNRWIVVIGISRSFEDVNEFYRDGVYGEEDLFCDVGQSEALVSEKVVESAPSHQINKGAESEPLDGRVLVESTVDMVRRGMSESGGNGRNIEAQQIVQFQVADDLFYYT